MKLRIWLSTQLHKLANWLYIPPLDKPKPVDTLMDMVSGLVREADSKWPSEYGEAKRRYVLDKLIKLAVGKSISELSLAIELAVKQKQG